MKKITKIDGCHHCPLKRYYTINGVLHTECNHPDIESVEVTDYEFIPLWCPLPNDNED
jgi:hypothetical protein